MTIVTINTTICSTVYSYLNPNNILIFKYIFGCFLLNATFLSLFFFSSIYTLESLSVAQPALTIVFMYVVFNNGIFSNNNNTSLTKASNQYYLLNLISVKAQEIYNYPLLPNGEYVYTTYGFKEDITNYLLYSVLFYIPFILIMLFYKKDNKMFLT
jgi:hypothetical protein